MNIRIIFAYISLLALMLFAACSDDVVPTDIAPQTALQPVGKNYVNRSGIQKAEFLYNHGVGYSYNAASGSFCNIEDVRCQVINRAKLDQYNEDADEDLLIVEYNHEWESDHSTSHSFVEYIQNTHFKANASANIMLIGGAEVAATANVFEDGTVDKYIVSSRQRVSAASYRLNLGGVKQEAKRHPDLLTASFREAVEHIKNGDHSNFNMRIDSFIEVYGTHVITNATLGAELKVDIQIKAQDYRTVEEAGVNWDVDVLFGLYSRKQELDNKNIIYKHLQDSKCIVSALGGDVSAVDRILSMSLYQVGALDEHAISTWRNSVTFTDGGSSDNSELIDMEVTPIWELIPDDSVAYLVRSAIEGNVNGLIARFGNRNFINASFTLPKDSLCYLRGGTIPTVVVNPDVVDVICAGRHVAAICRELVPDISVTDKVTVIYPIYEGRIKTTSGLCSYQGNTYKVEWTGTNLRADKVGATTGDGQTVYILAGVPSFDRYDNITYQVAKLIPECEMAFPIMPDGSFDYNCQTFQVFKHFGNFYLTGNSGNVPGIQNWTFETQLPAEAQQYSSFFDSSYADRMRRNSGYVYVYNPLEAKVP